MEAPTLQMVIVDGQPVYEVRLGLSVFRHRDRWQAEVVAHSWAQQVSERRTPPLQTTG